MPAYNAEKYIDAAIQSVIDQTFFDWELLVINDGSTDSTQLIIEKYCTKDNRVILINQTNKRQAAARNLGCEYAKGKWIAFLDSDDLWLPNKLEIQKELISRDSTIDVVLTNGYTYFEREKIKQNYHYKVLNGKHEGRKLYPIFLIENLVPLLSAVVKKDLIIKAGIQDESTEAFGCEDHDLWLRLCKLNAIFYGIENQLFVYNVHAEGTSSNHLRQAFASAYVRLKNFDHHLLDESEIISFNSSLEDTILKLKVNHQVDRLKAIKRMADLKGIALQDIHPIEAFGFKQFVKKTMLFFLQMFVFIPRKFVEKYGSRVNAQYIRWKLKNSLAVKRNFNVGSGSQINIVGGESALKAVDLDVREYSFLSLYGDGQLIAGERILINRFCNFNIHGRVKFGNNVLFNNYCALNCFEEIEIGDNTWFGEGVKLYDHNHKYRDRALPFTEQGYTTGKIQIGSNVWIGSNTVILQNVKIGDGCVIGANNLIYKSLEPNTIIKSPSMTNIDKIKNS